MDKNSVRRHYETLAKHEYNKRMLELELQSFDESPPTTPAAPLITQTWSLSDKYYKKIQDNSRAAVALRLERVIIDIEYLQETHLLSLKGV
jgi:hypothetical protein